MNEKTGLVVVTYNSKKWFDGLYETIPFDRIDECIIVNGGDLYEGNYDKHTYWLQHYINFGACDSRIDGIKYLMNKKCEHIFIIEDDMIIKHPNIFNRYVQASKKTGLKYLCFCSDAMGSGTPGHRTPKVTIDYNNEQIAFYGEMNNEFTYHHVDVFKDLGVYDTKFKHLWDVEFVYRVLTNDKYGCGFRYFPDVPDADNYIANHPESIQNSRTNAGNKRNMELPPYFEMFQKKHGYHIPTIPLLNNEQFRSKLKTLYKNK